MAAAILLYDSNCPMCRRAKEWIEARVRLEALEFLPCQSEDRARRAPQVSETECMEAMYLVLPSGKAHSGAAAFERLLPYLVTPWRHLRFLFSVPGASRCAPHVYAAIARNRMALSGLFRKKEVERCARDKGCG